MHIPATPILVGPISRYHANNRNRSICLKYFCKSSGKKFSSIKYYLEMFDKFVKVLVHLIQELKL